MSTNESEHWRRITVPKVRSLGMSRLATGVQSQDDAPLRGQAGPAIAHARCVEHVKVDGFRRKVCILKGQDRATVVAEARALGSTLHLVEAAGL